MYHYNAFISYNHNPRDMKIARLLQQKLEAEYDLLPCEEFLRLTEEELAPVACLTDGAKPCERAAECRTLAMWQKFYELTRDYFSGVTLADLMRTDSADMYVI